MVGQFNGRRIIGVGMLAAARVKRRRNLDAYGGKNHVPLVVDQTFGADELFRGAARAIASEIPDPEERERELERFFGRVAAILAKGYYHRCRQYELAVNGEPTRTAFLSH